MVTNILNQPEAEQVLNALGDQTRRAILVLLKETPMPVGDIAARLPISRPAVSKHLRILESASLVTYDSQGTRNIFRLRADGFSAARAYLDGFWDEALANFERAVVAQEGDA
jgi:DNA-binding transcriptional ArsR family regulator